MHIHVNPKLIAAAIKGQFPGDRTTTIKIGDRVRITDGDCNCDGYHSYYGRYVGCTGEVVRIPDISLNTREEPPAVSVGVLLDDQYNERSQYGCYWFKLEEIQVINEKESNNMLLLKGFKIAKVTMEGFGDQYVAHYEQELSIGDNVVVAKDGYRTGVVIDLLSDGACMSCTPKFQLVCKIDDSEYTKRVTRARKAKELESKLSAAVREYQQIALYEMLADKSPEIATLLSELKEVTGV